MPSLVRLKTRLRTAYSLLPAIMVLLAVPPVASQADRKASHEGWPTIDGVLLINKRDQSRPLDARAGHDPFSRTDRSYRCDGDHPGQGCFVKVGACRLKNGDRSRCAHRPVMPANSARHNELLGAHGDDRIYAGDNGDVLWADYKPSGQPLSQHDRIYGGRGDDFIYASHGSNLIHTGGGRDIVHARYGGGHIYCDSPQAVVNLSKRSQRRYVLHRCSIVTLRPVGTELA